MPPLKSITGLYVITSPGAKSEVDFVREALDAGAGIIQLREKDREKALALGKELRQITSDRGALLIINDFPDVARAVEADGVHLGQEDMPLGEARKLMGSRLIGISTHSAAQAVKAAREGADYVGIGPIYPTKTKGRAPIGLRVIGELRERLNIPFVAIGGINENNLDEVLKAGAGSVAVISALAEAEDLSGRIKLFIKKMRGDQYAL